MFALKSFRSGIRVKDNFDHEEAGDDRLYQTWFVHILLGQPHVNMISREPPANEYPAMRQ